MLFPLTFKSVGLARAEAKQGLDVYWGEALRRCWREGNGRGARSLEELSPALVYREVAVCRACYDVYRRLDKLRERGGGRTADAAGDRGSCSSSSSSSSSLPLPSSKGRRDSLAGIDATASSGRRAAAAEAGAVTLREEVGEMLKDVDARAGKPGVEAGIPWRRRLSKSKSTAGERVDQSRLVDKLSRPKKQQLHHPAEEERHTLPREDHTARRPTLKRQVKSQGDIPDSAGDAGDRRHHPQRRTSAPVPGGGFPSLTRARRRRLEPAAPVRGAPWQRTALPRGKKSAWPPLDDEGGEGTVASDHHASNPFGRYLEGSGGGGGGSGRSRETICAIEAMLEEGGGDSYLPARARDLPEALAVLGPPKPESSSKDKARGSTARKKLRHRGAGKKSGEDPERENNGHGTGGEESHRTTRDALEASAENGSTGRSGNDPGPNTGGEGHTRKTSPGWPSAKPERAEERFLHPWQRALEADKRAVNARTGGQHEAALLEEQRCRREARRAAAESKDCRRAGRRVAARLGRQHGRRGRRHRSGKSRVHGKGDRKMAPDRPEGSESRAKLNGQGYEVSSRDREVVLHRCGGDEDDDDSLRQLRDALGWARKTLEALMKRLKDRGIAIESARAAAARGGGGLGGAAKDWEIVRVLNKLRRRVAAFEDEGISLGVNKATTAEEGVAGAAEARSKCEAACESFEADFCHLIDELTATAKGLPSHPDLQLRSTSITHWASESSGSVPPGPGGAAASDPASRTTFRSLSFGLCSSCSVLPVARRCLDCDGDDRDRCSSCFVREHRDADRQRHRFLRISGCGREGGGTVAGPRRGAASAEKGAVQEDSSGGGARCSRCGDLAAARRCRDCSVDMCAACHFLAHRSPSKRSHVTEFVGETAVSMQEALQSRNWGAAAGSAAAREISNDGGEVAAKESGASSSSSPFSSPSTPQASRNVGNSGSDRVDAVSREAREGWGRESPVPGEGSFGKGAAQSLAQVRRTIDAPAVPPPGPSQSLGGIGSGLSGATEHFDGVGGESEDVSRDDARPIDVDPSAEVGVGGSTSLTDGDHGVHPRFEPPGDDFVEEEAAIPNGDGSPDEVIHRDGAGHYGGGGWNGWEEGQGRDERGNVDVEIPEEITGGDGEHGPSDSATHSINIKDDGRSRDTLRAGAGGRGEGADMAEDMFGGLEGIKEEEGLEGEETDTSSEEDSDNDDDDDEGMMWSPVNIAKVVVPDTASDDEEAEIYSPPFTSRAARTPDELDDIPATSMEEGEDRGNSQAAQTREATTPKIAKTPGPDEVTVNGAVGRRELDTSSPPPPPAATPKGEAATIDLDFALGSRKRNEEREGHGGGGDASPKWTLLLQTGAPKDEVAERKPDGKSTPPPPAAEIMQRADGPERTDHQETVESGCPSPQEAVSQNTDTSAVEADESNCR
ncbi:hypothetical protein Esi_0021_0147 [Ectocarpus siliculosus]|uniref:Uncharacterized protein n=1 Tax=Ectocarpus siliculosus TaxID=2880 RepID=D7FR03_ECTSI|nr:hypothetical protein Esi_0021_0147 [Ectocarpus siliculosus]|eukprot:CBJ26157.1 hypothetical protein Esi_0021_0147 [Ectocarpus siliculosus]